ncbi:MAG: hypothetical protein IKN50_04800 [Clostridia bacterium]|nr:hypothetical protein [Clostridia bacterium]
MKKIVSLILLTAMLASLCSCGLIRKATPKTPEPAKQEDAQDSESYATDFSEPLPDQDDNTPVRYTADKAKDLLAHSFPDYKEEEIKIEDTGAVIAENDGTEYYIFNVSLAEKTETKSDTKAESETETKAIVFKDPEPYYVSVNGVVHTIITGENVDNKHAEKTFYKKYGEKEEATGYAYKLVYEGVVNSNESYCYNFAVYKVNTSGAEPTDEYAFNYLVTIDGKLSAESKKNN